MSEWIEATVGDVVGRCYSGPSPTCEERNIRSEDEWGLLKTTAVTWDGWNELAHKVPPRGYWANTAIEVQPGDVLITKAGPRHRVGVVVDVPFTQPRLMVSGKMIGLTPNTTIVLPRILAGVLATNGPQKYLDHRTTGMAESQVNFTNEALLSTPIRFPTIREQQRITTILDTVDSAIRSTESLIAKLELMKRGLLHDLLTRGLDERGAPRSPTATSEAFAETQLGRLPGDWSIERLGAHLIAIQAGDSPDVPDRPARSGEWAVMKVSAVRPDGFLGAENKAITERALVDPNNEVHDGDLLMTRANTPNLVGLACLVSGHPQRLLLSDKTLRLIVDEGRASPPFVCLLLQSHIARKQIEVNGTGSSGSMKNISQAEIRDLLLPWPSLAEQRRICESSRAIADRIAVEAVGLLKLRQLKQGIIEDLLSGRVSVHKDAA